MTRFLSFITIICTLAACQSTPPDYEYWIKDALIVDGTGAIPYRAHVLLNADTIAVISTDLTQSFRAANIIEAQRRVLSPGFIDTHAHGNPLETPEFHNFLAMGVTTIFLGQDGFSPATVDLAGWMDSVNLVRPGVNIGLFAGHGTLRLLSGVAYAQPAEEEGLVRMETLLQQAMQLGCFGMSTGLEYNPGYLADATELTRLAKVVGQHKGMIMSHLRNEDDDKLEESLEELLEQGRYCQIHVSHIKSVYGKGEDRAVQILRKLEKARKEGRKVSVDIYPYSASYTTIGILFPDWAKAPADYNEVKNARREALLAHLRQRVESRNGPKATLIGSGNYQGLTLQEIATRENKPYEEVLVDEIGPTGASAAYFVMDQALMERLLIDARTMICSDGSPQSNHPRGYGTFAKILEEYVVLQQRIPLEEAIRKMTQLPAQTLGLSHRGVIKVGYQADLLLFHPENIKARATYENPNQLAEGFEYIWIGGRLAKDPSGKMERMGRVIKKEAP
jgi:N-acyl-D-amino-acid deacylase